MSIKALYFEVGLGIEWKERSGIMYVRYGGINLLRVGVGNVLVRCVAVKACHVVCVLLNDCIGEMWYGDWHLSS